MFGDPRGKGDVTPRQCRLKALKASRADWERLGAIVLTGLDKAVWGLFYAVKGITYPAIYLALGIEWVYQWLRGVLNPKIRIIIAKIIHH